MSSVKNPKHVKYTLHPNGVETWMLGKIRHRTDGPHTFIQLRKMYCIFGM